MLSLGGIFMLLKVLDVLALELSMLVIAVWLLEGNADAVEHIRGLLEDVIHLFEGAVSCLRVEEINGREDAGVSVKC